MSKKGSNVHGPTTITDEGRSEVRDNDQCEENGQEGTCQRARPGRERPGAPLEQKRGKTHR